MTEAQLAKRCNWWWRDLQTLTPEQRNHIVTRVFESSWWRSAFLYELGKRVTGRYEFKVNYCALPKGKHFELERRWPMKRASWISDSVPDIKPPIGWTPFRNMSFDLRLPDSTITKQFLTFIHDERRRQGVTPAKPNEGFQRRKVSFRLIELLDIEKNRIRALNDSERSRTAKAKKLYQASILPAK